MFKSKKRKVVMYMGIVAALLIGIMVLMPANTEPIVNSEGEIIPGSIAEIEKIKLGGVDQWLVIRGESIKKPVLLLLSGGPGSSEMGRFLEYNKNLENDF